MGFGSATAGRVGVRGRGGARIRERRGWLTVGRYMVGAAMFVCAFALWTVAPAAVFWLVPKISVPGSSLLNGGDMGPALAVLGAIGIAVVLGQLLAKLNGLYCRLTARERRPRLEAA